MIEASTTLGLLVWLSVSVAAAVDTAAANPHLSSAGKYSVVFEAIEQRTFTRAESRLTLQNLAWVVQGRTMVIRRVLDTCANAEQRAGFETHCLSLNLDTMKLKDAPCP